MSKKHSIETLNVQKPIGQYSQAIEASGFLFIARQVGQNPNLGNIIATDIEEEIRQPFKNMKSILEAAGLSIDSLVRKF